MPRDDSDIKIFVPRARQEESDVLDLVESMTRNRHNGNIAKAENLGHRLASVAFTDNTKGELHDSLFLEPLYYQQVCLLMLFAAETAVNYYLPVPQLSTIAITTMHQDLEQLETEIYHNVVESSAYSFYFLSVRKGNIDTLEDIGRTFAMLCQKENDPAFISEGRFIYDLVLKEVAKDIEKAAFQDLPEPNS